MAMRNQDASSVAPKPIQRTHIVVHGVVTKQTDCSLLEVASTR